MNRLEQQVSAQGADTLPASAQEIDAAAQALHVTFSADYREYLSRFGVISFGATEIYGLGIPQDSHLNILSVTAMLRKGEAWPAQAVPLCDLGDGYYYLYDNLKGKVLTWSMVAGVVETHSEGLEDFLLKALFQ